jgi:hypothetical protein
VATAISRVERGMAPCADKLARPHARLADASGRGESVRFEGIEKWVEKDVLQPVVREAWERELEKTGDGSWDIGRTGACEATAVRAMNRNIPSAHVMRAVIHSDASYWCIVKSCTLRRSWARLM